MRQFGKPPLSAADIPTGVDAAKIGAGAVSNTEFGYLDGVTSALQTQLNARAPLIALTSVSGTNTIVATATGVTLATGMFFVLVAANTISGAATLNINSGGAVSIKRQDGSTALSSGDIIAGKAQILYYDGTNFRLITGIPIAAGDLPGTINATTISGVLTLGGTGTVSGDAIGRNLYGNPEITSGQYIILSPSTATATQKHIAIGTIATAVPGTTFVTIQDVIYSPCYFHVHTDSVGGAILYWDGSSLSVWKGLADTNVVAAASAGPNEIAWRVSGGSLQASNNTGSSKNCYCGLAWR